MTGPASQALIVGAGPVGLTLALLLHKAGVAVTIIDRDSGPVEQSRAIWVHPRTLEIWDTIGMTPLARAEGREVASIQMSTDGVARAVLPYDGTGQSAHPHGLMLEQSRTQTLLLSLIADTPIAFSWRTSLTELTQSADGCRVTLEVDGDRRALDVPFVVGADGGSSTVRKLLGIEMEGGTYDSSFFLADVIADTELDPDRAHLSFTGASTIAVLPLPGDRRFRLIGNMLDQSGEPQTAGYGRTVEADEISARIAANRLPIRVESTGWTSTYRSHYRVASRFRQGRVLLAGDASHLHSPAGGLGMNTGIADAATLAWKLAAALDGAPDALLDSYDRERRTAAHGVIRTSDRLFVLQADGRRRFALMRRHVLPRVVSRLARMRFGRSLAFRALSGTQVRYAVPRSSDQRAHGLLQAGRRLPPTGIVTIDMSTAVRDGRSLLLRVGAVDTGTAAALDRVADRRGWPVIEVSGAEARRLAGFERRGLVVWVRPDRYVGWLGADVSRLDTELGALLGDG